jgi:Na+/H+ antiporter NhaD/arsenite permease-like protein
VRRAAARSRAVSLALACAANVGSAATLLGNPQDMLIGEILDLSFARYLWQAGVPALLGLIVVWLLIVLAYRGRWTRTLSVGVVAPSPFKRWQTLKGLAFVGAVIAAFLFTDWPREIVALTAAGVLLPRERWPRAKCWGRSTGT